VQIAEKNYPLTSLPTAEKRFASRSYFATIGARMVKGRDFNGGDVMTSAHVAIVNRAFVDHLMPGEDPIGKEVDFLYNTSGKQTIVGVVDNVKEQALDAPVIPAIYLPEEQRTSPFMYLIVRSAIPEQGLVAALRRELKAIDPTLPLSDVRSVDDVIGAGITNQRLMMSLLLAFSVSALLLAAIGLYGVISYSVAQRRNEIGIRVALGADRRRIMSMVAREGLGFLAIGLGIGLVAARASAQLLSSQLFGVTVGEPMVYAVVAALLGVVSLIALAAPAMRAARMDPVQALREE
jgi:predicted permease